MKTEKIIEAIKDIIASPKIRQYRIGLTKQPRERRNTYFGYNYDHFVILDTELSVEKVIKLEQDVFNALVKSKVSNTYKKYYKDVRDKATSQSIGGADKFSKESYVLYIAWRSYK